MTPALRIAPAADVDVDEQFFYLAQRSPDAARRFLLATERTFEELLRTPRAGHPFGSTAPRLSNLRIWRVQGFANHLVFYRESDTVIEIVRVLHAARDAERILSEED